MPQDYFDLAEIFEVLRPLKTFALAVSGGGDSMALMHMIAEWRQTENIDAVIVVLTVDHGLREASSQEAEFVCREAQSLGFEAHTILLENFESGSGLQQRARNSRYLAMADWLNKRQIEVLLTAHTLDDQAETFLMRLMRSSGVDGLSSMSLRRSLFGIEIVRPLLSLSGSGLRAWLSAKGCQFIDDPSNENEDFERIKVRRILGELGELSETLKQNIGRTTHRLHLVRDLLDEVVGDWISENVAVDKTGVAMLPKSEFSSIREELQLRVLDRLVKIAGGQRMVRYSKLLGARLHILSMGAEKFGFGGAIIDGRMRDNYLIYREPTHHQLEVISLEPGCEILWDGRVLISLSGEARGSVEIGPLSLDELSKIKSFFKSSLQIPFLLLDEVVLGLAALRRGGTIVSVPQLDDALAEHVYMALNVQSENSSHVDVTFPVLE